MHQDCNLNLTLSKNIPVVIQNLQKLRFTLYLSRIRKYDFKINVIPKTRKKYMSFTILKPQKKGIHIRASISICRERSCFKYFIR